MDFTPIIQNIQGMDIDGSEKDALLAKLADAAMDDKEKASAIRAFLDEVVDKAVKEDEAEVNAIFDQADAELAAAEQEFNTTMKQLQDESTKLEAEMNAEIDAANQTQ